MKCYKYTGFILAALLVMIGLAGCDSDNGDAPLDPPSAPNLQHVEMDFSVFEDAQGGFDLSEQGITLRPEMPDMTSMPVGDERAFQEAALFAMMSQSVFMSVRAWEGMFFNEMQFLWGEPSCDSSSCVWEFTIPAGLIDDEFEDIDVTGDISVTMEATFQAGTWNWELAFTHEGLGFDNAVMITVSQEEDLSEGSWRFHDPENPGAGPVIVFDYQYDGNITTWVEMRVDSEGISLEYTNDNGDYTLSIVMEGMEVAFIDWSSDGSGCITTPQDGTNCW